MYQSPIYVSKEVDFDLGQRIDEHIYESVIKIGINISKDELMRALQYDRDQYIAGYSDGYFAGLVAAGQHSD